MGQKNSKGGTIAINENGQVILNAGGSSAEGGSGEENYFQSHGHDHMIYSKDNKTSVHLDDFELLKVIGRGNFAKVLQVRKKDTGKIYAMKILNKVKLAESDQVEHIKTERAVMQYVEHPFLVNLLFAFQTPEKLYMVMEFVNGGELFFHLKREKRFPEPRVKFYAAELFLALEHIHKHNVVYRDLKPENILLSSTGHVLLTDFGLAKILSSSGRTDTFCVAGSSEISLGNGLSRRIEHMADIIAARNSLQTKASGEGDSVFPVTKSEGIGFGPGMLAWNRKSSDICIDGKATAIIARDGLRECVQVNLEDGRHLIVTPDHQVLAVGPAATTDGVDNAAMLDRSTYAFPHLGTASWIPARQLTPDHRVICSALYTVLDNPRVDRVPSFASFKLSFNAADLKQAAGPHSGITWHINDDCQRDKILSFARLCGIAQSSRVRRSTSGDLYVVLDDSTDAAQFVADIQHVFHGTPAAAATWEPRISKEFSSESSPVHNVTLPETLVSMLFGVGCIASDGAIANDIPSFIKRQDCPPGVIREYLAAFWGGAGDFALDMTTCNVSQTEMAHEIVSLFKHIHVDAGINNGTQIVIHDTHMEAFAERCGVRYNALKQRMWGAFLAYSGYKKQPDSDGCSFTEFARRVGLFGEHEDMRRSFALRVHSVIAGDSLQERHHRVYDMTVADHKSFVANGMVVHNCGTPEYLAPEVLLQQGHGKPVDWWSYGTLLYEMLVGIPPFYSDNIQEMYDMILHADLVLPDKLISPEAQDLLARLLERNPKKRLGSGDRGSDEIKYHPFFRDINWDDIYHKRIPPPFIPKIKDELDTSYFDEEFTSQPPVDSFQESSHLGESVQKEFEGFTFTGKSKLAE